MVERDARQLLAALAGDESVDGSERACRGSDGAYRDVIDRATEATSDLDAATTFVAEYDLEDLEGAVERAEADLSKRGEAGRAALDAFRRLRMAAGSTASPGVDSPQSPSARLDEESPSVSIDDGR